MVVLGLCFLVIRVLMNQIGDLTLMMMLTQSGAFLQSILPRFANHMPCNYHSRNMLLSIFFLNALLYKIRKHMGKEKITEKKDGKDIL